MNRLQALLDGIYARGRIKIDLIDLLRQLNTPEASALIKRYLEGTYRMHSVLKEQADYPAKERMEFINEHLSGCIYIRDQFRWIKQQQNHIDNLHKLHLASILDCGVWKGNSTRALARMFPNKTIYAFDSFEGLPDNWVTSTKGTFKLTEEEFKDLNFPSNSEIFKGWFSKTLPLWKSSMSATVISLIRIDCDIYSSTKDILDSVGDMFIPGTVIIFDELIGYLGWQNHEFKALDEFLQKKPDISFKFMAFGETFVAGIIVSR